MVPNGNKDKRLSLVNHTTKATHRHHHRHEFCKEKNICEILSLVNINEGKCALFTILSWIF